MARWITVRSTFDYRWPDWSAITAFGEANLGDNFVKDEVADFAVQNGYATEGKLDEAARSVKGGAKRVRSRAQKETIAAETADPGSEPRVGDADVADADRTADRPAMDHDAG